VLPQLELPLDFDETLLLCDLSCLVLAPSRVQNPAETDEQDNPDHDLSFLVEVNGRLTVRVGFHRDARPGRRPVEEKVPEALHERRLRGTFLHRRCRISRCAAVHRHIVGEKRTDAVAATHQVARLAAEAAHPNLRTLLDPHHFEGVPIPKLVDEPAAFVEQVLVEPQDTSVTIGQLAAERREHLDIDVVGNGPDLAGDHPSFRSRSYRRRRGGCSR
jgi:hypothetical protein